MNETRTDSHNDLCGHQLLDEFFRGVWSILMPQAMNRGGFLSTGSYDLFKTLSRFEIPHTRRYRHHVPASLKSRCLPTLFCCSDSFSSRKSCQALVYSNVDWYLPEAFGNCAKKALGSVFLVPVIFVWHLNIRSVCNTLACICVYIFLPSDALT